jgi:hypothetical protein
MAKARSSSIRDWAEAKLNEVERLEALGDPPQPLKG